MELLFILYVDSYINKCIYNSGTTHSPSVCFYHMNVNISSGCTVGAIILIKIYIMCEMQSISVIRHEVGPRKTLFFPHFSHVWKAARSQKADPLSILFLWGQIMIYLYIYHFFVY